MTDFEKMCYICAKSGTKSRLRLFQINLTEAVRLCSAEKCTYPFESMTYDKLIVERDALAISTNRQKKAHVPPQQQKYTQHSLISPADKPLPENSQSGRSKEVSPGNISDAFRPHSNARLPSLKKNKTFESYCVSKSENAKNVSDYMTDERKITISENISNNESSGTGNGFLQESLLPVIPKEIHTPDKNQFSTTINKSKDTDTCDTDNIKTLVAHIPPISSNHLEQLQKKDNMALTPNSFSNNNTNIPDSPKATNSPKTSALSFQQSFSSVYLQWQNSEAMCWLDVILCMLVHSRTIQTAVKSGHVSSESVIGKLVTTYNKTLEMININVPTSERGCSEVSKCVNEGDLSVTGASSNTCANLLKSERTVPAQTGAGIKSSIAKMILQGNYSQAMIEPNYSSALKYLHDIREDIFKCVQPKLQCAKGKNDSPVFALPILLRENKDIEQMFKLIYRTVFKCKHCGCMQTEKLEKTVPSFPCTVTDFNMHEPGFEQFCFKCNFSGQKKIIIYESVPEIMVMHFIEGLPFSDVGKLDFVENGVVYSVTALVQYKKNPDHFVTWIRNANETAWMECDDLKSPLCQLQNRKPTFQPKQIHLVMWEKSDKPVPVRVLQHSTVPKALSADKSFSEGVVLTSPAIAPHSVISDKKDPAQASTNPNNTPLDNFRTVQSILLKKRTASTDSLASSSTQNSTSRTPGDSLKHSQKSVDMSSGVSNPKSNLHLLRKITHLQRRRSRSVVQPVVELETTVIKTKKCSNKTSNKTKKNLGTHKTKDQYHTPSDAKKPLLDLNKTVLSKINSQLCFSSPSPVVPPVKKSTSKRNKVFEGYVPRKSLMKPELFSSVELLHSNHVSQSQRTRISPEKYNHSSACSPPDINPTHSIINTHDFSNCEPISQMSGSTLTGGNVDNITDHLISSSLNNPDTSNTWECLDRVQTLTPQEVKTNNSECSQINNIGGNNASDSFENEGFLSSEEMEEISSEVDDDFLAQITDMPMAELSSSRSHSEATENTSSHVSTFLPLSNERECQILQDLYTALCIQVPNGTSNENK